MTTNNTTITAEKAPNLKCERCWNYRAEYNEYFEDNLCKRCVDVLCELEEKGQWLKCPACTEWFFEKEGNPDNINDNYICPDCLKEMENYASL